MTPEKKIEHKGRIIRAEIRTTATPRQVWEAWTDPAKIAQWFVDRATGEPRVGTTYTWFFDKFNYTMPYEVLEAIPEERFSLYWSGAGAAYPPGIIEVKIEREAGITIVRVVNSGFQEDAKWDEQYEGTVSGWQMAMAILKHYLENYFGQPKTLIFAMRPAQFSYEQLMPFYTTAAGLGQWLATSGTIGKFGEQFKFALLDGGEMTGRVLAITRSEVALSCEEISGTIELKAFSMGPGKRTVGIRCLGWGMEPAQAKEIEGRMESALERLVTALGNTATASPAP
jgi:uncharacterized protein YndB with AHSA1/START domain